MPAAHKTQSLDRLLELLKAIPSGRLATSGELQQRLSQRGLIVDTRTVQRDLRLLQQHFALECDDRSKPHGWRWKSAGARDATLGLSTPEALGLVLLQQHLQSALPANWSASLAELFDRARAALDKLGPLNGAGRWPAKVHVVPPGLGGQAPALPPAAVLAAVSEALMNERQLRIDYRKPGEAVGTPSLVHPVGLLLRGRAVYLVALRDEDRHGPARHFALHRVADAQAQPAASALPAGVDMGTVMAQSAGQFGTPAGAAPVTLHLHCDAVLARLLEEAPLSEQQQLRALPDGRFELKANVLPSWELRWWLLAHIGELEILAPRALREELGRTLAQAAARHAT